MNCNLLQTDNKTERYLDVLYKRGFMCGISVPTRVAGDSKTCIDHIFVNHKDHEKVRTAVMTTSITDHYTVALDIQFNNIKDKQTTDGTYTDYKHLSTLVNTCDWSRVTDEPELNRATDTFHEMLTECFQQATKQKASTKAKLDKLKPWITEGLVRSIRTRDRLSKRIKKQPFNLALKRHFLIYRNTLNTLLRNTKTNYYRTALNDVGSNPKHFWKFVNELSGRTRNKDAFPLEQYTANRNLTDENDCRTQVADEFNTYFSQVGYNLAKEIDSSGNPVVDDNAHTVDSVFTMTTVTEDELQDFVHSLRSGSAAGYDLLSADFLKTHFKVLCKPLLHIVNTSITTGQFPETFKVAKVIPIYKGAGDISLKSNFRPISLLSTCSKVLEKIVKHQLTLYINQYNILTDCQYGFRETKNFRRTI